MPLTLRQRRRAGYELGGPLIRLRFRTIPFGIAAVTLGFFLKTAGTQADPAESGLVGSGLSVFGTIHPDIFRLRPPLGSGDLVDSVRVASLEPPVVSDGPGRGLTETSTSTPRGASLNERLAALNDQRLSANGSLRPILRPSTKPSGRSCGSVQLACNCRWIRPLRTSEPIRH